MTASMLMGLIIGMEGSGKYLRDLLSPILIYNDKREPWRLGVEPKQYIYHEPKLPRKFMKLFNGYYFAIGDKP